MSASSTVLVIAPHPDDEILGCGGSMVRHVEAGHVVHVLYLTSGERASPHHTPEQLRPIREAEATNAAGTLGIAVSRLHFARFPDGGIQPADLDRVGVVVRLLREVRPELVSLPHAEDALTEVPGARAFDDVQAMFVCEDCEFAANEQSGTRTGSLRSGVR